MKNISKKILIIFMVFLLILSTNFISHAANDEAENVDENLVNYDNDIALLDDDSSNEEEDIVNEDEDESDASLYEDETNTEDEQSYDKNYFYAGSEDLSIDKPVYGDAFIFTSGAVNINTTIVGNVFVCASTVTVNETGDIQASLFNASNSLTINGSVGLNVYNCSNKLDVSGLIVSDLFSVSREANISGEIYGNSNITSQNISISDTASIEGDLNYVSNNQITVPENVVGGKTNYSATNNENDDAFDVKDFIVSIISFIILVLVIFVISKWFNCKFTNDYLDFTKNLPKTLLYGFLGLILTPILCVILLICGVTMNLAFILMAIYFVLMLIASSIVVIVLSKLAVEKLQPKFEKMNNTLLTVLSIAILSIIYKIFQLIPVLGTLITFVFVVIGIGILIKSIIPTKQQKNS